MPAPALPTPQHWLELSEAILTRDDYPLARRRAGARIERLIGDLCELLMIIPRLWDAYQLVLATLVFGTLVPVDMMA